MLLGGNIFLDDSVAHWDAYAAAYLFMNMPLSSLLLTDWQQELAQSMSWAFGQGFAGVLSNVYQGERKRERETCQCFDL